MARLDRFMPVKEIAQIGAAIGREFSYELIAAVAPMGRAAQLALSRMALSSAIAHLESGLRLINSLPASPQRNDWELQLRTTASVAWEAFRGWPAPQITDVLLPALTLAKRSGQPNVVARTLWGLWVNPLTQGQIAESLRWADELMSAAEVSSDEGLTLIAHMAAMVTHFWAISLPRRCTERPSLLFTRRRSTGTSHWQ